MALDNGTLSFAVDPHEVYTAVMHSLAIFLDPLPYRVSAIWWGMVSWRIVLMPLLDSYIPATYCRGKASRNTYEPGEEHYKENTVT